MHSVHSFLQALAGGKVLGPTKVNSKEAGMQQLNRLISRDSRVSSTMLPFGGGTYIIVKQ